MLKPVSVSRLGMLAALGFWTYYFVQRSVLGPLHVDEIYFTHVFWMVREGHTQYVDFYSNHLPTYFVLLRPMVFGSGPDLGFVWVLRGVTVLLTSAYMVILYWLCRERWLSAAPLLLAFIILGYMAEIRPDTFGLLLFNAAWFVLLSGRSRPRIVLAAVLGALAMLFSARAAVMMLGMATLCLYLARHDKRAMAALVACGFLFLAALAGIYLANPDWAALVVRSVFVDPTGLMPTVSMAQRLFNPDRAVLFFATAVALAIGFKKRDPVIVTATVTQIGLIFVDPSPFQYIYGWAAIPTIFALTSYGMARWISLATAAAIVSAAVAYIVVKGHEPPTTSIHRLTFDSPIDPATISTPDLAASLLSGRWQQGLWNQLHLRTELCRRIDGTTLAVFTAHPICLRDTIPQWIEIHWPPTYQGSPSRPDRVGFYRALPATDLFVWGKPRALPELLPEAKAALHDFDVHKGFAIKRR